MTPKQIERIKKKITDIKKALAAEKRMFGGYHDGRGLRYAPLQYFIQLDDYTGGLNYIRWFYRNFPGDVGNPSFLFECTVVLFKKGKLKDAEKKAFEIFCSSKYLLHKFFGKPLKPINQTEESAFEVQSVNEYFKYSNQQSELMDFAKWLEALVVSEKFIALSVKYISIQKQLEKENDPGKRSLLLNQEKQLINEFCLI